MVISNDHTNGHGKLPLEKSPETKLSRFEWEWHWSYWISFELISTATIVRMCCDSWITSFNMASSSKFCSNSIQHVIFLVPERDMFLRGANHTTQDFKKPRLKSWQMKKKKLGLWKNQQTRK